MLMTHCWLRVSRLSVGGPEQNNDSWVFFSISNQSFSPLLFGKLILCHALKTNSQIITSLLWQPQANAEVAFYYKWRQICLNVRKREKVGEKRADGSTRLSQFGEAQTSQRWIFVNFLCLRTHDVTRMSNDGISQPCFSKDKTSLSLIKRWRWTLLFKSLGSERFL